MTAQTQLRVREGALVPAMQAEGLSVRKLAERADISPALAGFLRQEAMGVSLDRAIRVAGALGRDVNDLFEHKNGDPIGNVK